MPYTTTQLRARRAHRARIADRRATLVIVMIAAACALSWLVGASVLLAVPLLAMCLYGVWAIG